MKITFFISFLLLGTCLHAQDTLNNKHDSIPASIKGGQATWIKFLEKNIHSAVAADHGARPGNYVVTVSFLIDTTGKVSDVQVLNDPGYGTAEDVLKAFKHCPDWIPANIDGKKVIYRQKQNITYQVSQL